MFIHEYAIVPDEKARKNLVAWLRRHQVPYKDDGLRVEASMVCSRRFADELIAKFRETGADCIGAFRVGDRLEVYHDSC